MAKRATGGKQQKRIGLNEIGAILIDL